MASDANLGPFAKAEAEIVPQMMRLVLSFFLREHECRIGLTKLLRPFVAELCDQARTHGFGTPEGPSNFDTDALAHLAERYKIEGKLSAAWDGQLSQPEKLQIDRVIGASDVDRLEYAIQVTANVLELALVMATSTSVDGEKYLHNEVQRKQITFLPRTSRASRQLPLPASSSLVRTTECLSTRRRTPTIASCRSSRGSKAQRAQSPSSVTTANRRTSGLALNGQTTSTTSRTPSLLSRAATTAAPGSSARRRRSTSTSLAAT